MKSFANFIFPYCLSSSLTSYCETALLHICIIHATESGCIRLNMLPNHAEIKTQSCRTQSKTNIPAQRSCVPNADLSSMSLSKSGGLRMMRLGLRAHSCGEDINHAPRKGDDSLGNVYIEHMFGGAYKLLLLYHNEKYKRARQMSMVNRHSSLKHHGST